MQLNIRWKAMVVAGAILASSLAAMPQVDAAVEHEVNVEINDQIVHFPDARPFIDSDGRTEVPVRFVSQSLGYDVQWDGDSRTVTMAGNDKIIVLQIGSNRANVNGQAVFLDTRPYIVAGRTFVPLRFVAENSGARVQWIPETWTVNVDTRVSQLLADAVRLVGTPYQWGGTTPSGFDCSGFVDYVFAQEGLSLPRTAAEMYRLGTPVGDPQPGDLVFFTTDRPGPSHVGIYLGNQRFISATTSRGVRISNVTDPYYWGPRYIGARRFFE
jgi:peptidoglycan endopeptidase LytE